MPTLFTAALSLVLTLVLALSSAGLLRAQAARAPAIDLRVADSSRVQIIVTRNGSTFIGRIVEVGETEVRFETDIGIVPIAIDLITEVREMPAASMRGGTYWFPNPNTTRLLFSPTGRALPRGRGYFANHLLFFSSFAVGLTDRITLGGGMSLFPSSRFFETQLFFVTPKIGLIQRDRLNVAAGALLLHVPDFDEEESSDDPLVGVLYGVTTVGPPDASITTGVGYGFRGGHLADAPAIMFGGEYRASRRIGFVTENFYFAGLSENDGGPLISYAMRFLGERFSADLGFVTVLDDEMLLPGVPYVDFVFGF
jgi:hypothetical protein